MAVSEIFGNAAAVAISNAYYPDGRTAGDNVSRLGVQIGLDAAGNILKEFWPDLHRKLTHGRGSEGSDLKHAPRLPAYAQGL